jgi:hypothetical protein
MSDEVGEVHEDSRLPNRGLGRWRDAVQKRSVSLVDIHGTARLLPDPLGIAPMIDVVVGENLRLDVIDGRAAACQELLQMIPISR